MNRIIISSIAALLVIAAAAIGYIYYQQYKNLNENPENAIPADAAFFLRGNLVKMADGLRSSEFKKFAVHCRATEKLKSGFVFFDSLLAAVTYQNNDSMAENSVISFHATGANQFDMLFIIPLKSREAFTPIREAFMRETPFAATTTRQFDGVDIFEIASGRGIITCAFWRGLLLGSFTSFLVEDAIRQQRLGKPFGNERFSKHYAATPAREELRLCINLQEFMSSAGSFFSPALDVVLKKTSNESWIFTTPHFIHSSCEASGQIISSPGNYIYTNSKPGRLSALQMFPENTLMYQAYVTGSLVSINRNYNKTAANENVKKFSAMLGNEVALISTAALWAGKAEIAFIKLNGKNAAALMKRSGYLSQMQNAGSTARVEKFGGFEIRTLNDDGLLPALFGEAFNGFQKAFYITNNEFVIASARPSVLRMYITDYLDGKFLVAAKSFNENKILALAEANYFYFTKPRDYFSERENESDSIKEVTDITKSFLLVISGNGKKTECNFRIEFAGGNETDAVQTLASCQSDSGIVAGPAYFADGDNAAIVLQDTNFNVSGYDKNGTLKWSIKTENKIVGNIYCKSFLENGKPQVLFSTATHVYFLDDNGNALGNFPIKLPAVSTTGIYLDTVQKANNFFTVCSNKRIYGYELSGRPLKGWEFVASGSTAGSVYSGFKNNIHYIWWIDSDNRLHVHDETGKLLFTNILRQPLISPLTLTTRDDSVTVFAGCDSTGSIFNYYTDGSVTVRSTEYYGIVNNFFIEDLSYDKKDEIIFVYENGIYIYDKSYDLKFTFKTGDEIISSAIISDFTGKKAIAYITAENPGKVYAINEKAKSAKGFPVQGDKWVQSQPGKRIVGTIEGSKRVRLMIQK